MKKVILISITTVTLLLIAITPALATGTVTLGTALPPYVVRGEGEFQISDSSTICIRAGASALVTLVLTGEGIGYRWYYHGQAFDGFYCGGYVDNLQLNGSLLGLATVTGVSAWELQGIWGYKKVLNFFTFDVGITAMYIQNGSQGIFSPGLTAALGVAF